MLNKNKKTVIISEKQIEQIKKVRQGLIAYENTEPDYEIGFEGTPPSDYAHVIQENQNDKKANDYIKKQIGIQDFNSIRNFIMHVYSVIPYARYNKGYYLLGVIRVLHENNFKIRNGELNKIIYNLVLSNTKLDRNLNGLSFEELKEKYHSMENVSYTDNVEKVREADNGYIIKYLETFEDSYNSGEHNWCITYNEHLWSDFVEDDDSTIYLVENPELMSKIDYKSEEWNEACMLMSDPTEEDLGKFGSGEPPYDDYGLSRFVVIINPSYFMVYSRWNIPNMLDGEFLTIGQLEKLLGMPFNHAFPYIKPKNNYVDEVTNKSVIQEMIKPEDVDLSSFEIQNELNPKFWKDNKIDSRIRLKLLDIADDFFDSLNVKWVEPEDIIMTGSLANFTWNEKYSDIDLHIVIDYTDVDDKTDFVKEYFKTKKKEWENKHENLTIFGFPVEVYVQDKNEKHTASGIYSLEKNKWIKEPDIENFDENDYDDDVVKNKVSEYTKKIDDLLNDFDSKTIESDIEDIYNKAISLFDDIKDERNDDLSVKDAKELSNGNLIFKSLRRNGYIEKLIKLRDNAYDKCNSLS